VNPDLSKRLRQIALVLGAVALGAFMLWDPAKPIEYEDGKTHIQYWNIAPLVHAVPPHITLYNESQDSVVVHPTPIPWQEHEKKILTAILSGDPPDVISQFVPVVRWASRMALRPLDDFIEETQFDSSVIFPALWDEVQWQGRTFAIPIRTASYAFFFNKDAFREVGIDPETPPGTWEEVRAFARQLDKWDESGNLVRAGFLPGFSPGHTGILGNMTTASIQAWELGAQFLNDDGTEVNLASPEMIQAAQWSVDYYDDYDLGEVAAFVGGLGTGEQHGFLSGKLAMIVLDMSFIDLIKRYRPDLDYGVVETPSFPGYPTASTSGSFWMGIPRGARNPRAAWDFIRSTVSKQVQLAEMAAREDDLFPANRLAAYDSTFMSSDMIAVFVRQMDFAHSPTVVPLVHGVFWREFIGALERSVLKKQPTVEAFEQAERVVQDALDRAGSYDRFVRSNMAFETESE
jgi:ABC-type glycerol-3-phosphate transport system substrate-binding protein